jgi:hypothetical protein
VELNPGPPKKGVKTPGKQKKGKMNFQSPGPVPRLRYASSLGAAETNGIRSKMGLGGFNNVTIGCLTGYVYVGNGTLGATDSIYTADPSLTYTVTGGGLPCTLADSQFGQTYVADIFKHFARKKVKKLSLEIASLNPSTSNSMVVNIAPHRGGDILYTPKTDTTAANSQAGVMGASGAIQLASWQSAVMNFTPYIAGGSGPGQNEFDIQLTNEVGAVYSQDDPSGRVSPAAFYVSGSSTTTALRGTKTHALIWYMELDLLDFIGGISNTVPELKRLSFQDRVDRALTKRMQELSLVPPPTATTHSCAASAPCLQCGTRDDYVSIVTRERSKPLSL